MNWWWPFVFVVGFASVMDIASPVICSHEGQVALFLTFHSSTRRAVEAVTLCSDFSAGFNLSLAFVLSLASRWITAVIWYHTLFLNHNAFLFGGPMKYWCFIALEFKFVQYVLFRLFCFVYFSWASLLVKHLPVSPSSDTQNLESVAKLWRCLDEQ